MGANAGFYGRPSVLLVAGLAFSQALPVLGSSERAVREVLRIPLGMVLARAPGAHAHEPAGVLFSMLAAAGLGATWLFKKARILAIFDDLDTVLFMNPGAPARAELVAVAPLKLKGIHGVPSHHFQDHRNLIC